MISKKPPPKKKNPPTLNFINGSTCRGRNLVAGAVRPEPDHGVQGPQPDGERQAGPPPGGKGRPGQPAGQTGQGLSGAWLGQDQARWYTVLARLGAGLCLRPHSHMHVQLTKTENSVVLKKAYLKKCSGYKNTLIREFVRDNNLESNIFTVFSCR